jgi:hypothetical protein
VRRAQVRSSDDEHGNVVAQRPGGLTLGEARQAARSTYLARRSDSLYSRA